MRKGIFVLGGLLAALGCYLASQQPKFSFGPERTGVALLRGGYRSWYVECAYGRWADTGKYVWHWPAFRHFDVRPLLAKPNSK